MRTVAAFALVLFLGGCVCLGTPKKTRPEAVIQSLFVDRLHDRQSFNYFVFWGLPLVENSLDPELRATYDNFTAQCERMFPPWGKWEKDDESKGNIPPLFAVFARNDPLTMCATPPARAKVSKIKEDATTAVYTVTYKLGIDGAIGEYYTAISTVSLIQKNGKWLVSDVSNNLYGDPKVKTYTFVGRLKELSKLLSQKQ